MSQVLKQAPHALQMLNPIFSTSFSEKLRKALSMIRLEFGIGRINISDLDENCSEKGLFFWKSNSYQKQEE